ncbi:protein FAM47E-like [Chlamydotis macqueenii]
MSYKGFRERRLRISDSLNGQRWIFLKKGLDDFRDGFPPSPDNMIVYGRKRAVLITLHNSMLKSSPTALWKKRKKCTKTQVCLSKLSWMQQARRDYVAQIECCLNQLPLVPYLRLEKIISLKEMQVSQLRSTQAFKEFLERNGYRKPWFLPKMLAGGNDTRGPEETSKACKKVSKAIGENKKRLFHEDEIMKTSQLS